MKLEQLHKCIEKIQKGKQNGFAIRLSSKEMDLFAEGDYPYPLADLTLIVDRKKGKFNKSLNETTRISTNSNQVITALYKDPEDKPASLFLVEHIITDSIVSTKAQLNFINGEISPIEDLNFICLFWRYGMDSTLLIIHQSKDNNVHFSTLRSNNILLTNILFNFTQAFSNSNGTPLEHLQ